ncbi:hypothetical protein B0H14DRAFT_3892326 [Mycena olivaceomarginata]|nr:hypothetical protein B0H14DRAFT_3892326 [Mycena olivaceomarginata]
MPDFGVAPSYWTRPWTREPRCGADKKNPLSWSSTTRATPSSGATNTAEPMLLRRNNAMRQYARYSDADAHSDRACSPPRDASAHSALRQHNTRDRIARAVAIFWMIDISFPFLIHHRRPALGISRRPAETIHRLVCAHQRSLHVDTRVATHRIRPSYSA